MDRVADETERTKRSLKDAFVANTFRGLDQGVAALKRFSSQAVTAQREINKLSRANKNVSSVDATVQSGGGGGGGAKSAALNALVLGKAATAGFQGQTKSLEEIRRLAKQIKQEFRETEAVNNSVAAAAGEVENAYEAQLSVQKKIDARQEEIRANEEIISKSTRNRNNLQSRLNKKLIKNVDAVKAAKIEIAQMEANISDANTKITNATRSVNKLNDEFEKTNRLTKGLSNTRFVAPKLPNQPPAGPTKPTASAGKKGGGAFLGAGSIKGVLGLAAAYVSLDVAIRQVNKSIQVSSNTQSAEQRIRALSDGYDDYGQVLEVVNQAAAKFNIGNLEASNAVAQLYGRLRPLGLTLSEIETVFNGFNTAAALTGATAAESSGALLQLSQALGAGALRGEEFNSVAEQAPAVIQAIGNELDVPIGQLKELAKQGVLTSDIIVKALARVEREGADKLAAALDTPAQKFKTLENRVEDLNRAFGDLILPAVISGVEGLSGVAEEAAKDIDKTALAMQALNEKNQRFRENNPGVAKAIDDFGDAFVRNLGKLNPFSQAIESILQLRDKLASETNPFKNDGFIGPPVPEDKRSLAERLGLGKNDGEDAEAKAQAIADAAAKLRRATTEAANENDLFKLDKQIEEAIRAGDKFNQVVLEGERRILEIRQQAGLEIEGITDEKLKQAVLEKANVNVLRAIEETQTALLGLEKEKTEELAEQARLTAQIVKDAAKETGAALGGRKDELKDIERRISDGDLYADFYNRVDELVKAGVDFNTAFDVETKIAAANQQLEKQRELTADIKNLYEQIGSTIADGLVDGITSAIDGTKSLQEVLSDVLKDVGKLLIQFAVRGLGASVGIPGFADGGRPEVNKLSIVGEKGPELFVPDTAGTIIPNDAFAEARGAMGLGGSSSASSDGGLGPDSPAAVAAFATNNSTLTTTNSYMKERAMERESQTTIGSAGSMVIETQVINNVEYASVEQLQKATAASARQARAQVFSDLKNKPSARASVGMR